MTVNVLLVTHKEIGDALLNAVTTTLGDLPLPTTVVTVNYDTDPDELASKVQYMIAHTEHENGLLILTDLYGSTPSNIATCIKCKDNVKVIAGLNLPMLIRVMNYPNLNLGDLAQKALSGGKDGIINCTNQSC